MRLTVWTDMDLTRLAHEIRYERLRRRGSVHSCAVCGQEFVARAGARTCSTTCRVRAQRARANLNRKGHRMIGIGYEGLSLDALIERLRAAGVEVLIDVRLNAISRKVGYSKRALAAAVESAGIRYVHDPRLGNPKENRAAYADVVSVDGAIARERFRTLLGDGDGAEGVRELADLVKQHTVAVLCYEADEMHCHRQQVMTAVREAQGSLVAI